MIGQTVSHYRILEKLGEGAMGEVYLGEDVRLRRQVAIKFPKAGRDDERFRAHFLREAQLASQLNHERIATVYDCGETPDGQPFIVMELVRGEKLSDHLRRGEPSLERRLEIIEQVTEALAEAHSHGIIHRDIKPANVVLNERGQVKVLDFGLAKQLKNPTPGEVDLYAETRQDSSTREGVVLGTPHYMSPEQAKGSAAEADARSDIFSLGAVLYECLAGRPPFSGATAIEVIAQVIHTIPPPPSQLNSRVSRELDHITLKALAKEPEGRYQSAKEFNDDLRVARASQSVDISRQPTLSGAQTSTQPDPTPATTVIPSPVTKALSTWRQSRQILVFSGITVALLSFGIWGVTRWWTPVHYFPSPQARRFYDDGVNALRDGAYYKASKAFEQVVSIDGDYAIPHAHLAEAWMESDYTDRAKDELRRAYALASTKMAAVDALYLQALNLTVDHNFTGAIEKYLEIAGQAPDDEKAYAYVDLGRAYERNEEVERAMNYYTQAKQRDPRYATAPLRLGMLYSRQQEYDKAAVEFAEAEKDYEALTNAEGLNEALYQQGVLLSRRGQITEARVALQRAHDNARDNKNLYQQIATLLQLSLTFYAEGKTVPAQERAQNALDLAHDNGLENLTTQGLIDLGNAFYQRREYDEAERHFSRALEFASNAKGRRIEALARLSLGRLYLQKYIKMDEATLHLEQALTFFQKGGYRKEIAETVSLIGRAKLQQGDYATALRIFDEQLHRARQINDWSQIARLYSLIGRTLADQDGYPEALRNFEESYSIYESLGNKLYIAYALLDRGDMLWRLGRDGEARRLLNQALAVADQLDSKYKQVLAARNHLINAQLALSKRSFSEAVTQSQRALAMADTLKRTSIEAKIALGLARVFIGDKNDGRLLCEEAIKLSPQENDPRLYSTALLALAEAKLENGDARAARIIAIQAQERFALAGQPESEWRAWLVASRASLLMKDYNNALAGKSRADSSLSQLSQKWGKAASDSYLARSDVRRYLDRLNQISMAARQIK